jgi:hypothetical protein
VKGRVSHCLAGIIIVLRLLLLYITALLISVELYR